MKITATLHNKKTVQQVTVETNGASKQINFDPKPDGSGSSINGGELLLLSIATCFCNDIYREAKRRNIVVNSVNVTVEGDFEAEAAPGSNFQYKAAVSANASDEEIEALIKHVDEIAEIHQTLRKGIAITLI